MGEGGGGVTRDPLGFSVVIDLQAYTIRGLSERCPLGLIASCVVVVDVVVIFGVSKRLSKYD